MAIALHTLGECIDFENGSNIIDPPAILHKGDIALGPSPTPYELDDLSWGTRCGGPSNPVADNGTQTPITPSGLEMSRPASLQEHEAAEVTPSLSSHPMQKWRFLSACVMSFTGGLNDSAPGALLPYLEKDYSIGYAVVSLIFVSNAVGFITAAPFTQLLLARIGRAKLLALAQALMVVGYTVVVCRPPFPAVVISFFLLGIGMAFTLALNNVFCANLVNSTTLLGHLHGSYGVGGSVGPLIATALVSGGQPWSRFYFISLSIAIINVLFAYYTFRSYEIDFPSHPQPLHPPSNAPEPSTTSFPSSKSNLRLALHNPTTVLASLFIFAYQGAEVSISGWVISFLLTRSPIPNPSLGYVTAGFWAGITLGRFLLSHPAQRFGEKRSIYLIIPLTAAFQLLVWLLPNVIGEAVAVSIVGLLLGPVYPCATVVFVRLLGRGLQTSGLAFVSAMGSSGGAAAPFATGMIAQKKGTWVLHPICLVLFAAMGGCWGGLGRVERKRRE
ncbi:MAG: hypothetical protein Q9187_005260 [Circinaria calcarea]